MDAEKSLIKKVWSTARDRIADPANWIQGRPARDKDGMPISIISPGAICFCVIGSIRKSLHEEGVDIFSCDEVTVRLINKVYDATEPVLSEIGVTHVSEHVKSHHLTNLNDRRQHQEVIEFMDRVIASI